MEPSKNERTYNLNTLYFYLTEGCNLRCRHCWIAPKYEEGEKKYTSLNLDTFKHIIKQAKPLGLRSVKLTGGEPLIHPEIDKIINHIKEQDLGFTMETNGVSVTEPLAKKIRQLKRPFVSVSLDGAKAETNEWVRGVKGCFDKSVEGIKILVKENLNPQIIMSIMEHNKHEIEDLVSFAADLKASSVKFNIVQPTERGKAMHEQGQTLGIEKLIEIGKWVEQDLAKKYQMRLHYSHPMAFKSLSAMFGDRSTGTGICGIFGILGVLSNGLYALCGIGESIPELVFGDANKDELEKVWKESKMLNEIRDNLPKNLEGVCADCLMKNMCLGSCIAQNYYKEKNLMAPFWFCSEAREKGLFPKTRLAQT
ncbi:MAG: SynChlorMet cassette radical SAM/SPASM protein ScmF [Pseudomonadota bacterium]